MNQILYGVGSSVLRDFLDNKKVVALSKLKDININGTANDEKVYGGDNPYPLATFPKDKAITISATNATFSLNMLNVTQGANITTGVAVFTDVVSVVIPSDGQVTVDHEISGEPIIEGFTKAADLASISTGNYFVDTADATLIHFAPADSGKEVDIVYDWNTDATAQTLSVGKDTLAKPFKFIHRIPVYDDNNRVVAEGQLTVYKAQAKNAFEFNLQSQTAFAPKFELEALDPKRMDKKLWDFTIAPVK
ncbi:hypothetical protein [Paenibacillus chitinolyticus]|uniref:hypothetical protein n=1 Tax=Paenibacillus chitinolyticus TaxID=79263 RepID=UPI003D01B59D